MYIKHLSAGVELAIETEAHEGYPNWRENSRVAI